MEFWQAMKALDEGKKITRTPWEEGRYIYKKGYEIYDQDGNSYQISIADFGYKIYDDRKDAPKEIVGLYYTIDSIFNCPNKQSNTKLNQFFDELNEDSRKTLVEAYKLMRHLNNVYKLAGREE